METKYITAIFEAGKLRPLAPLDLKEHEQVEVAVFRTAGESSSSEDDYQPALTLEADATVTLEQVHAALAKIPGSLTEEFSHERDERF